MLMRLDPLTDVGSDAPDLEALWQRVVSLARQVIDLRVLDGDAAPGPVPRRG